jgi:hypothetical protein
MASSSPSDPTSPFFGVLAKVRLRVAVGNPLAEVFLIDHGFTLVARSVGNFDATVEPGVYTVKARLGNEVVERLIALFADDSLDFSGGLRVASSAPLEGTLRTHEFHIEHAAMSSGHNSQPALSAGNGAEIFLMARRWSSREPAQDAQAAASGTVPELSLLRPDGKPILDLTSAGEGRGQGFDPFLGRRVAVDPGAYLLRWRAGADQWAEQSVQAVRDWQTQVFLLEDASRAAGAERRQISILMGRPGDFRPDDPELLKIEAARLALANERKVATEQWLAGKFENPMLGLFGAHLMLITRDALAKDAEQQSGDTKDQRVTAPVRFDQGQFDHAVRNLAHLLGPDHPDVVALSTQTASRRLEALAPVTMPPMLWRSWLLLIEASNDRPQLLPVATWRRAIALLPLRPFLVWSPEDHAAMDAAWEREIGGLLAAATPQRQPARDVFGGGPGIRGVAGKPAAGPTPNEARRSLSLRVLAPRAAIDALAATPRPAREESP